MEYGPHKLTFELLAAKVGLVPAALVRRFKNKQQLLLNIDRFALERTNNEVEATATATSAPLETIIAQFVAELSFASTVQRFANGQEFLLMDLRKKELYDNYQASFRHRHAQIVNLLEKAQAAGELTHITDSHKLARHLEVIAHGTGHSWAMTQEGTIADYLSSHISLALEPYKVKQKKRMRFIKG